MIIIIFFENMLIDAFLACLFKCSLFNIFVYGSSICIYLTNISKLVYWLLMAPKISQHTIRTQTTKTILKLMH